MVTYKYDIKKEQEQTAPALTERHLRDRVSELAARFLVGMVRGGDISHVRFDDLYEQQHSPMVEVTPVVKSLIESYTRLPTQNVLLYSRSGGDISIDTYVGSENGGVAEVAVRADPTMLRAYESMLKLYNPEIRR